MSNYTKATNFTAKDSLPSGDSQKIIRGSEFDTEFNAISTAIATKLEVDGSNNLAISGTFSATKLIPTGGTATGNGMYLPAANAVAISTNGTERLRIDSGGNFGIGTSSPGTKLDVSVTRSYGQSADIAIALGGTDNGYVNSGAASSWRQYVAGNENGQALRFDAFLRGTGWTERMRLDYSGNLGLGVTPTNVAGYKKLEIGGTSVSAVVLSTTSNNAAARNWATAANFSAFGDYVFLQSNALGGDPVTAGTALMTLDASGNLLMGTSSIPVSGKIQLQKYDVTGGDYLAFVNRGTNTTHSNTYDVGGIYASGYRDISDPAYIAGITFERSPTVSGQSSAGSIVFRTENIGVSTKAGVAERARIDSSGNFFVSATALTSGMPSAGGVCIEAGAGNIKLRANTANTTMQFSHSSNTALVGSITVTASATAYNTSSDYRLKDNQAPLSGSGAFIDALQPKTWNWKADGSKGVGFIAHEVQAVSPSSVVGTKDAVDAEGKPVIQGMEYGSAEFIANIVAELQSLRARVATLENN